jgi:hypothetical protein
VKQLIFDHHIQKEQALLNVYQPQVFVHYPVYPSAVYTLSYAEEAAKP